MGAQDCALLCIDPANQRSAGLRTVFYGSNQCDGGMLVIDPTTLSTPTAVIVAFNSTTNTGVVPLNQCGPNGATVGPHAENLFVGLHPG